MKLLRRICVIVAAFGLLTGLNGCSFLPHFLQPEQLEKLNRGPNGTPASDWNGVFHRPETGDGAVYFASVPDDDFMRPSESSAAR